MHDKLITIARFKMVEQADMAKAILSQEGIECFLAGEHFAAQHYGNIGEVQLQVLEPNAERAIHILNQTGIEDVERE